MSLWTIFGDSLIKSYLMIYSLPRTYNISNVALHTKIQLNALIRGGTSFVLIEFESPDGE